jgi:hypothetical protein
VIELPALDDRTYDDFVADARALIPTLAPGWTDHNASDPGIVLVELFAWLAEMVLYRIDRVPETSYRTFLELLRGPRADTADPLDSLPVETLAIDDAIRRTVVALRTRERAITPDDFEYIALERWPTIAGTAALGAAGIVRRARCIGDQSPATLAQRWKTPAIAAPGHYTLIVVPQSPLAVAADVPAFAPARGTVLELDGATGYVDCGADAQLSILGALTLSAWIFPRSLARGRQGIVAKSEYALILETNGALTFQQAGGTDGGTSAAGVVAEARWSHVAAVRAGDGKAVSLYVDAKLVCSVPLGQAVAATTSPVQIGRTPGGMFFDGFLRDVEIWAAERDATQLGGDRRVPPPRADDYAGAPPPRPALAGAWAFAAPAAVEPDCATLSTATGAARTRDGVLNGGAAYRPIARPLAPSSTLLQGLQKLLDEWRLLTTHADIVGYTPLHVTVTASLYLRADADLAAVPAAAVAALAAYLDPLTGGQGAGWPFGRAIYAFDVQAVLDGVPGVDFVKDIVVSLSDPAQAAALVAGQRPPNPCDEAGAPIGVALQPDELPSFEGATLALYQRLGTTWQKT